MLNMWIILTPHSVARESETVSHGYVYESPNISPHVFTKMCLTGLGCHAYTHATRATSRLKRCETHQAAHSRDITGLAAVQVELLVLGSNDSALSRRSCQCHVDLMWHAAKIQFSVSPAYA